MAYAAQSDLEGKILHCLDALVQEKPYANGLAVIASNDYGSGVPSFGIHTDLTRVDDACTSLNFARFPVQNVSNPVLLNIMHVVASFPHYRPSYGHFVFVFRGHGSDDGIMTQDGTVVRMEGLIRLFQPGRARKMAHWPKMFFIDACRDMHGIFAANGGKGQPPLLGPEDENTLIAYSPAPKCRTHARHAEDQQWLSLLTGRLAKVDAPLTDVLNAVNREAFDMFQKERGGIVQLPHFESSLPRDFSFPKAKSHEVVGVNACNTLSSIACPLDPFDKDISTLDSGTPGPSSIAVLDSLFQDKLNLTAPEDIRISKC